MAYSLQRTVTGAEPVTLAEMKNFFKLDEADTTDDALITGLLIAARERAEQITGRCIVTSTFTYYLDSFPYNWYDDSAPARNSITKVMRWWANAQLIRLPMSPVQEVTAIAYLTDNTNNYTTLDSSLYTVDTVSEPCVCYPINNVTWPSVYAVHNCVQVTYTAGYGDSCPETIKAAIRMLAALWWENRTDSVQIPKAVEYLLFAYRSQACGTLGQ